MTPQEPSSGPSQEALRRAEKIILQMVAKPGWSDFQEDWINFIAAQIEAACTEAEKIGFEKGLAKQFEIDRISVDKMHRTHRIILDVTINAESTDIEKVELKRDDNIRNEVDR